MGQQDSTQRERRNIALSRDRFEELRKQKRAVGEQWDRFLARCEHPELREPSPEEQKLDAILGRLDELDTGGAGSGSAEVPWDEIADRVADRVADELAARHR